MLFQKYDPRAEYFDPVLDRIRDGGLMDSFFSKWRPLKNMREDTEVKNRPLVIEHFFIPGMMTVAGVVMAAVAFAVEYLPDKIRDKYYY